MSNDKETVGCALTKYRDTKHKLACLRRKMEEMAVPLRTLADGLEGGEVKEVSATESRTEGERHYLPMPAGFAVGVGLVPFEALNVDEIRQVVTEFHEVMHKHEKARQFLLEAGYQDVVA